MPYIPQDARKQLDSGDIQGGGSLCYLITMLCKGYLLQRGESYDHYGEVRHALATTWDEYVLPRFRTYEAKKRETNGEV